jgi:hypothetical protein
LRIVLLVEGLTETAIVPVLREFLDAQCEASNKPRVGLDAKPLNSQLLRADVLRDHVTRALQAKDILGVVALIDVVVSGRPQHFKTAAEAIAFLKANGAPSDPRYRAHAAQHDFEAWLLPYWDSICTRLKVRKKLPGANPEAVNHHHPPSTHLADLYKLAKRTYDKPRDGLAILRSKDLTVAAAQCPQFRLFLNSLLELAGCPPLSGGR